VRPQPVEQALAPATDSPTIQALSRRREQRLALALGMGAHQRVHDARRLADVGDVLKTLRGLAAAVVR